MKPTSVVLYKLDQSITSGKASEVLTKMLDKIKSGGLGSHILSTIPIVDNNVGADIRETHLFGLPYTETQIFDVNVDGLNDSRSNINPTVGNTYPDITKDNYVTAIKPTLMNIDSQPNKVLSKVAYSDGYVAIDVLLKRSRSLSDRPVLVILKGIDDSGNTNQILSSTVLAKESRDNVVNTAMLTSTAKVVRFVLNLPNGEKITRPYNRRFSDFDLGSLEVANKRFTKIQTSANYGTVYGIYRDLAYNMTPNGLKFGRVTNNIKHSISYENWE